MNHQGRLPCDSLLIEVTLFCKIIFELLHVVPVLEVGLGVEGCDLWSGGGVLDEPVALVFEGEHEVLVEVAPVLEEDSLVILVVRLED